MYDIIIIGGGPAGLTAALYAQRAGKKTLVLEGGGFGGQIVYTECVENYPGRKNMRGAEFADELTEQVIAAGADTEFATATAVGGDKIKTVVTDSGEYTAKSVIIAAGVKHRRLGIEGEESLIGRGISFCAVCDGAFFNGKTVAVVGGGNTAFEDAIYLSDIAEKVYLIHRRDSFRAEESVVNRAKEKRNIEFVLNSVISEVSGENVLEKIVVKNVVSKTESELDAEGLFVAIGQIPGNENFKSAVTLDENGYIVTGSDCAASKNGVFAAGDCRAKEFRQLTTAVSDGTVAALSACGYIDSVDFR